MRSTWLCACVLLACGPVKLTPPTPFSTGRGTSIGAAKTVMIGATGGALTSDDGGVKLEVPAGALATSTALTLEPITCLAPGCTGEAWRFGPDGTTFATPATLRFQGQPT